MENLNDEQKLAKLIAKHLRAGRKTVKFVCTHKRIKVACAFIALCLILVTLGRDEAIKGILASFLDIFVQAGGKFLSLISDDE